MASLLVQSPQILQLIDDESGEPCSALDLIGTDRVEALRLYKRLHLSRKTGEGQVLCELCGVPVYVVSTPDKQRFFFRHFQEDGSCPSITRGQMTEAQINALRFHGQRESKRHIRIKQLLAESLLADKEFSVPVVEGTWKGKVGKEYRRPDVRADYQALLPVAFEVQLSTTFGRVMAEREVFYKNEGALLLWIFGEFSVDRARLMMEVVFANNNRNAFIVNELTLDESRRQGRLVLECVWAQPAVHEGKIVWSQRRKLVGFDELTIDRVRQRSFFYDSDEAERKLLKELEGPPLATQFQDYWLDYECFEGRERPDFFALQEQWGVLTRRFAGQGVEFPHRTDDDLRSLVRIVFLAKFGRAVGWQYKSLWPAAHRVHDAHRPFLWLFMAALQLFGRIGEIEAIDSHGKWAWKVNDWKDGVRSQQPEWAEDHRYDEILKLAFPELAGLLPVETEAA